jgi:hypothetical protein
MHACYGFYQYILESFPDDGFDMPKHVGIIYYKNL